MTSRFNPKIYQGKDRIYTKVSGYANISKLWIWFEKESEYQPPIRGNSYYARKRATTGKRLSNTFSTLNEAKEWQRKAEAFENKKVAPDILFKDVVEKFKTVRYSLLKKSSKDYYEKIFSLYFSSLMPLPMSDFSSAIVDDWLNELRARGYKKTRTSFLRELEVLKTLIGFCQEHFEGVVIGSPIKKRHRESAIIRSPDFKAKDITREEFNLFAEQLKLQNNGLLFCSLATVQYFQALRISEACAIKWQNIHLDLLNPRESFVDIRQSVYWQRKKGGETSVIDGFKNSKKLGGKKTSNLMKEAYLAFSALKPTSEFDLVFTISGAPLEYRQVQHAFDSAFKMAKLPYSGTHILRHGGASLAYNMSNGNMAVAAAQLGNTVTAAQTYAHLDRSAQKKFASSSWENESQP
ncbi:MAG: tyrosine-type recombinase/integrase [Bdellovibrionota bacterium]